MPTAERRPRAPSVPRIRRGSEMLSVAIPVIFTVICAWTAAGWGHEGIHHDVERESAALHEDPSDIGALTRRARYYRLEGELDASLADLDRARELAPASLEVALQRGLTLSALGRDGAAEAELDRVLRGGPDASAFAARARIRARGGRPGPAISDLDAAIGLEPGVDLYLERGRLQEAEDRLDDAARGYREGIERLGDAVLLERALVEVEVARGRYDAALERIDRQLARGGVATEWLLLRARAFEGAGRREDAARARREALDAAEAALRRRPTSAHLVARAEAHLALGDEAAARRDLEQALRSSPRLPRALHLLEQLPN